MSPRLVPLCSLYSCLHSTYSLRSLRVDYVLYFRGLFYFIIEYASFFGAALGRRLHQAQQRLQEEGVFLSQAEEAEGPGRPRLQRFSQDLRCETCQCCSSRAYSICSLCSGSDRVKIQSYLVSLRLLALLMANSYTRTPPLRCSTKPK